MKDNIGKVLERGEKLSELEVKSGLWLGGSLVIINILKCSALYRGFGRQCYSIQVSFYKIAKENVVAELQGV